MAFIDQVKNIKALQFDFASFVTALNDSIQGDKELETARLRVKGDSMPYFTGHPGNNGEDNAIPNIIKTLLRYLARHLCTLKARNEFSHRLGRFNPCRRCGAN